MILRGLLAAAVFSTVMASQPQIVQIKSSTPDLAKTGVHLVSLDDIGYTATVQAIIGEDRTMVEPILPYGVLVVNGSSKNLTTVGVAFMGQNSEGQVKRLIIIETAYSQGGIFVGPVAPGASMIFTPDSMVNQYLALQPRTKRKSFLPGTSERFSNAKPTPVSGVSIAPATDFPTSLQQKLSGLPILGDLRAYLECAAFDDDSYVGPQHVFENLKRDKPGLHR